MIYHYCLGCIHEGQWYDEKQAVPSDDCNACWCNNPNMVACTKKGCPVKETKHECVGCDSSAEEIVDFTVSELQGGEDGAHTDTQPNPDYSVT